MTNLILFICIIALIFIYYLSQEYDSKTEKYKINIKRILCIIMQLYLSLSFFAVAFICQATPFTSKS